MSDGGASSDSDKEATGQQPTLVESKPLTPIQWDAYSPPAFTRAFIPAEVAANAAIGADVTSYLPVTAAAFLTSDGGKPFRRPTPCQAKVWPLLLGGRDVLCVAPTGTGKTLAYLLPALVVCAEAAKRWKQAHAQRKALLKRGPVELGGRGAGAKPTRSEGRFIGFSSDPGAPCRPAVLVVVPTRELAAQVGFRRVRSLCGFVALNSYASRWRRWARRARRCCGPRGSGASPARGEQLRGPRLRPSLRPRPRTW